MSVGGWTSGEHGPRLLVGVDDHPATLRAVGWAAREATMHSADLGLVQVHPPGGTGPGPHSPKGSASQRILRTGGDPRLLVLASSGRGALGTALPGSTCRAVFSGARCPVAVLPSALASSPDPELAAHPAR